MVMEQYLINDTTLSAIGDAIRQAKGEEKYFPVIGYSHTSNVDSEGNIEGSYDSEVFTEVITLPEASSIKVTVTFKGAGTAHQACLSVWEGNHPDYTISNNYSTSLCGQLYSKGTHNSEYIIEGDSVTFGFYSSGSQTGYGYYAIVESLDDDIKINPNTNYLPSEIPQQITEITTLDTLEVIANGTYTPDEGYYGFDEVIVNIDMGNIPEEAFVIKGDCTNRFAYGGWDWFIKNYGDKVTTEAIDDASYMFYFSDIEEIPFELNFGNLVDMDYVFSYCRKLKTLPKLNSAKPTKTTQLFNNCICLREIPADWADNIDWSYITSLTGGYVGAMDSMFNNCFSLRSFPMDLLIHTNPYATYSNSIYSSLFNGCHSLDEVVNLPIAGSKTSWISNAFRYTFDNCYRLKRVTFEVDNKSNWKTQTIDLSKYVGYTKLRSDILSYREYSGITADKEVTDDATYQALKDDPDWFTIDVAYSRYNHDSAVETINSLPDTSAYLATTTGTNTIKFKGAAGSATDGGAINTLTEEEIAVATAKGWTVTLV